MKAENLVLAMFECGIEFATGVPDSLQKEFCTALVSKGTRFHHVSACNEGSAIGIAIGYNIATDRVPLVYMQNSGLGNALNPLASLAHKDVYGIPMVLMIGWRGQPGTKDEPQHITQGLITRDLLELLQIPYLIVDSETDLYAVKDFLITMLNPANRPIAILVTVNTFESTEIFGNPAGSNLMTREIAIKIVTSFASIESIFVSTTGKLSRELNEIREQQQEVGRDFMTVGGMGHTSSIALGLAITKIHKTIICLDGDGAALMHLGAMAMIGELSPKNIVHVILNNGTHESVGGQPVAAKIGSYGVLAESLNYRYGICINTEEELVEFMRGIDNIPKPCLLEIRINSNSRSDLSRPKQSPIENKISFKKHLKSSQI